MIILKAQRNLRRCALNSAVLSHRNEKKIVRECIDGYCLHERKLFVHLMRIDATGRDEARNDPPAS